MGKEAPITYSSVGVNYDAMDPLKRMAQIAARRTSHNLKRFGMREIEASRGESAYVWEEADSHRAMVIEGLGTKNLVADAMRDIVVERYEGQDYLLAPSMQKQLIGQAVTKITGQSHYNQISQCTIAMIVNDLLVVGADPMVVEAYWAAGDSKFFEDEERCQDLVEGWADGCNQAGASWGGGETPTLKGIIYPGTIDLAGSAIGMIKPKDRLTLGERLTPGDAILLVESSGIHANGLTLARTIASRVSEGYTTRLSDGTMYGEALLAPTHIYAGLVRDLFDAGIDIHYMVNITGHGWRKLMRANKEFSYVINELPPVPQIFEFIKQHSGSSDYEMYGNFNMGAGFAIYLPSNQVVKAQKVIAENGFKSWNAGMVQKGPRKVIIEPKQITFEAETLGVR